MNASAWIRAEIPALQDKSDEDILALLKAVEKNSSLLIIANVLLVWLLTFVLIEESARYLGAPFFHNASGWLIFIVAFIVSSSISKLNHKRYMKVLIARKLSTLNHSDKQ